MARKSLALVIVGGLLCLLATIDIYDMNGRNTRSAARETDKALLILVGGILTLAAGFAREIKQDEGRPHSAYTSAPIPPSRPTKIEDPPEEPEPPAPPPTDTQTDLFPVTPPKKEDPPEPKTTGDKSFLSGSSGPPSWLKRPQDEWAETLGIGPKPA